MLAVATAIVASCGGGDDGGTLRVYSGRHYDVEAAFTQFSDETGIDVEFRTGNDTELRELILEEGDETQADVYLTVDAGNLAAATDDGIFQPLDSSVLDEAIPATLRDPDDNWFGLAVRARTIVFTTDESRLPADERPQTYEELADPEWAGRLCLRRAADAYQQSLVASLIANDGYDQTKETVDGWVANAQILPNDTLLLETIAEGGCDVGISNHYYLARLIDEDPSFPVDLLWANQTDRGVHLNVSGGGVTKYADDPELAQQFLEWLATDGQKILVDGNFEYPANPTIEPATLLIEQFGALDDVVADQVNAAEWGRLNPEAVQLMSEAGYD